MTGSSLGCSRISRWRRSGHSDPSEASIDLTSIRGGENHSGCGLRRELQQAGTIRTKGDERKSADIEIVFGDV
jgi:hypothetical protein